MSKINRRDFPPDEEVYIVLTNLAKARIALDILRDLTSCTPGSPEYGVDYDEQFRVLQTVGAWIRKLEARV